MRRPSGPNKGPLSGRSRTAMALPPTLGNLTGRTEVSPVGHVNKKAAMESRSSPRPIHPAPMPPRINTGNHKPTGNSCVRVPCVIFIANVQ